ncbi:PREDICTED: uncharacterized protein LOC107166947 [Diuraphis noxia]|uniref:uncharacterized protein LOC107166947 n=1 Tax=Diuraphis noxia TaxID=143948 RepID=UPI0007637E87|nr:PREDICTED: uncharacterized protein LOC107166947 [Diuraphis noxia]
MMSASNAHTHNISYNQGTHVNNSYLLPLNMGRMYRISNFSKRKQNRGMRHSTSTTSSALALLAFLFFLNILQRSLDENKQGPVLMTRIIKQTKIRPRNDFIENEQFLRTVETTTRDNIMVTKFENIYNK